MIDLEKYRAKRLAMEQKKVDAANDPRKIILKNIEKRITENGECWEWLARVTEKGYGLIYFKGNVWRAHRLSYLAFKGEFDRQLCMCHTCDNPVCVNPAHLFVGTTKENTYDSMRKGRFRQKPEIDSTGPLSKKRIKEIRTTIKGSNCSLKEIADYYKVPYHFALGIKKDLAQANV